MGWSTAAQGVEHAAQGRAAYAGHAVGRDLAAHPGRVIVVAMDGEARDADVQVGVLVVDVAKAVCERAPGHTLVRVAGVQSLLAASSHRFDGKLTTGSLRSWKPHGRSPMQYRRSISSVR